MATELDRLTAGLSDRYRLVRELGRGGMATVYLAEDPKHGRSVAVKVLRRELAATLGADRFLREIAIAARLTHPNILPLHDSGEAAGLLYYVMPFVEGESLRDRLQREKQLPVDEAIRIAREVAAALSYAHGQGVIHRDIKPENILLSSGQAVVADFGIARALSVAAGSTLTGTGIALGTLGYMSPEQASGETDLDARVDVYALGCTLYEMLAGETPHTGGTVQALLNRMLTEPVRPLHPIRETVPPALDDVLGRALARTPADRFPTVSRFADALAHVSTISAAEGAMGSGRARGAEGSGRRWRVALSTAAVVAAVALGGWIIGSNVGRGAGSPSYRRLAVLPLDDVNRDTAQDYFVDGLTDALIGTVAQIGSLEVISRTSVMQYRGTDKTLPEIGRELNVDAVVEGSVSRSSGRVLVRVHLVDARTDAQLWSRDYDRELGDILLLQSEIAREIARHVDARLTKRESDRLAAAEAVNPEVHEEYLRGRFQLEPRTPDGFREALDHFRQALQLDPTFAPAHAGLADYYRLLPFYDNVTPAEAFGRARAAALKALELDPSLGVAHAALGYVVAYADWDWAQAEGELRQALELNPNDADTHHAYSRLLAGLGRLPEAEVEARRADELDPLSLVAHANLGVISYFGRDYARAASQLESTLEIDPDFPVAHWGLGLVNEQLEQYDQAVAEFEKAMALAGRGVNSLASLAHVLAVAGRTTEAEAVLDEVLERTRTRHVYSYQVALVYASLGRADEAFDWLERAYEERSPMLSYAKQDPRFDDLRSDARFADLLRRVNLAPPAVVRQDAAPPAGAADGSSVR